MDKYKIGSKEHRATPDGRRWVKNENLKNKYGITLLQYEGMLSSQDYKCAICAKSHQESKYGVLCIDHDHATGGVRSLLCRRCNLLIGAARECPSLLFKSIQYLEVHNGASKPVN